MASLTPKRVKAVSTSTGSGDYEITGTPFAGVLETNESCHYTAFDLSNNTWEVGLATLQVNGSLARSSIIDTSNGNTTAIAWGAGTRQLAITVPGGIGLTPGSVGINQIDARLNALDAELIAPLPQDEIPAGEIRQITRATHQGCDITLAGAGAGIDFSATAEGDGFVITVNNESGGDWTVPTFAGATNRYPKSANHSQIENGGSASLVVVTWNGVRRVRIAGDTK